MNTDTSYPSSKIQNELLERYDDLLINLFEKERELAEAISIAKFNPNGWDFDSGYYFYGKEVHNIECELLEMKKTLEENGVFSHQDPTYWKSL